MKNQVALKSIYLPIILSFLLADELCSNFVLSIFSVFSTRTESILYILFLLTVIVFSPIQAGFSDRYCRKKSLVVSLTFSLISASLILLGEKSNFTIIILSLIIITKGGLGNTLPLSLAGVADGKFKDTRFSMALCTGAMATGYLVLILLQNFTTIAKSSIIISILLLIVLLICINYFNDIRDKEGKTIEAKNNETKFQTFIREGKLILHETSLIKNEFKCKRTIFGLLIFVLWEISQYSVHCLNADLRVKRFSNLTTAMVCGYLLGLLILKILKNLDDKKTIRIGFTICLLSVVPYFILYPFLSDRKILLLSCYFFYNLGTVFLAPSLFSILAKERKPHEQGVIFGLLESVDTIAFLVAATVAIVYVSLNLPDAIIAAFSSIMLLFSWVLFQNFETLNRK